MSINHSSDVATTKSDPVFLHIKARMTDVIWVDGSARNPKIPTLFQVADIDSSVINWIKADLVTNICPRV